MRISTHGLSTMKQCCAVSVQKQKRSKGETQHKTENEMIREMQVFSLQRKQQTDITGTKCPQY